MDDKNSLRVTHQWDVYGWLAIAVLMLLFILVDLVNLDFLQAFLVIPAIIIFFVITIPNLIRRSSKHAQ